MRARIRATTGHNMSKLMMSKGWWWTTLAVIGVDMATVTVGIAADTDAHQQGDNPVVCATIDNHPQSVTQQLRPRRGSSKWRAWPWRAATMLVPWRHR